MNEIDILLDALGIGGSVFLILFGRTKFTRVLGWLGLALVMVSCSPTKHPLVGMTLHRTIESQGWTEEEIVREGLQPWIEWEPIGINGRTYCLKVQHYERCRDFDDGRLKGWECIHTETKIFAVGASYDRNIELVADDPTEEDRKFWVDCWEKQGELAP